MLCYTESCALHHAVRESDCNGRTADSSFWSALLSKRLRTVSADRFATFIHLQHVCRAALIADKLLFTLPLLVSNQRQNSNGPWAVPTGPRQGWLYST